MVNYWLTLTDEENWNIIKENNIYAVKSEELLKQFSVGDLLVMYLIPKQISGIFEIKKLKTSKQIKFNSKEYSYFIDITPLKILSSPFEVSRKGNRSFIDNISIFKNSSRWGTILMGRSVIKLIKEDYEYIKKSLNKV